MIELLESKVYEFEEFRLDAKSHRLYRSASGELVPLTPKAVELLLVLVQNRGRIVAKDELLDTVWGSSFVEEANLSQTIFVLRKTLGENTKEPHFILTAPNRGYQFIAPVKEKTDDENEEPETASSKAYQSYVRGKFFWNKRTGESLKEAIGHFEQAIAEDPNFAQAYKALAECHSLLAEYYAAATQAESFPKVANNSLENNNKMAEAHAGLAYAQAFYDWDWAGAEVSFKRALELNPNYARAHQWYADYLNVTGQFERAREHIERAIEIEPHSPVMATGLAALFYTQRQPDKLIKQAKKIIRLDSKFAYGWFYLGFGYEFSGMYREAVETFAKTAALFGEPEDCGEELKEAFERGGMTEVWHKRLEQYETRPHLKNYPTYLKSLVPIRLGYKDMTLALLNQAYQQRDRGIIYAKYEPFLEPLRDDLRFQDLLHRLGL